MKKIKTYIVLLIVQSVALCPAERYTGFHIAGLPNASYKDGEGYAVGGNLFFYQYGDGRKKPYAWNSTLAFKMSTEGMLSTYLFMDVPHIMGAHSRFNFYVELKRYLVDDYYGLGNRPDYHPDYLDPDHPQYKDKLYYSFKQRWPGLVLSVQKPAFLPRTRYFLSLGFYNRHVELYAVPNKLQQDKSPGWNGGVTSSLACGLITDTRDQEATPQTGVWSEIIAEYASPLLGSTYEYVRLTLTDRRYITLLPGLVYAHRLIFEPIMGRVPFYDMAIINGSFERHLGLGGAYSLRGVPRLLFVGQHKLLGNFELRYEAITKTILKQNLTFFLHTFVDAGRVWLKDDPFLFNDIHSSYGVGLHMRWNKDLVGAIDVGRSKYSNLAFYITFRNLF
ncbi:BamA/TamA family outer membrane protein [candidate division KSB1 bacterium]|nr:BamA/TamA family outer membrane protein [candidate division KSB1 bacterium]